MTEAKRRVHRAAMGKCRVLFGISTVRDSEHDRAAFEAGVVDYLRGKVCASWFPDNKRAYTLGWDEAVSRG